MSRLAFVVGSKGSLEFGRLRQLKYPERDADRIRQALESPHAGYEVIFPAARTHAEIILQFEVLAARTTIDDALLFYFSGHGVLRDGALYFLLDASTREKVYASALPYAAIKTIFRLSGAGDKIIILDCCHAGEAAQNDLRTPIKGGFDEEAVKKETAGSSASVLVACGPDGYARESDALQGGVMTSRTNPGAV